MQDNFKDKKLAEAFKKDGFVTLPLLDAAEVERLVHFYDSLKHEYKTPYGFHVSIDDGNFDFIKKIHHKIIEICLPKLGHHLSNIRAFSGRFLAKDPNRYSIVTPHQDWTFVDEKEQQSAIVWIALVDVGIKNGALGVLRGSHQLPTGYRATPLPLFQAPYEEFSHELFPHLELIPMKAGEAMVMDNRLVHGSPPNVGDTPRLIAGFEIAHQDAQLLHYYLENKNGQSQILKYNIDKDFFYKYSNAKLRQLHESGGQISGYEIVEKIPYNYEKWTREQFWEMLGGKEKHPYQERMKALFDYSFGHSDTLPDFSDKPERKSLFKTITSFIKR